MIRGIETIPSIKWATVEAPQSSNGHRLVGVWVGLNGGCLRMISPCNKAWDSPRRIRALIGDDEGTE